MQYSPVNEILASVAGQMRRPPRTGKITEQDFSRPWSTYCRQWIFTAACLFVGAAVAAPIGRGGVISPQFAARDLRVRESHGPPGPTQNPPARKTNPHPPPHHSRHTTLL